MKLHLSDEHPFSRAAPDNWVPQVASCPLLLCIEYPQHRSRALFGPLPCRSGDWRYRGEEPWGAGDRMNSHMGCFFVLVQTIRTGLGSGSSAYSGMKHEADAVMCDDEILPRMKFCPGAFSRGLGLA